MNLRDLTEYILQPCILVGVLSVRVAGVTKIWREYLSCDSDEKPPRQVGRWTGVGVRFGLEICETEGPTQRVAGRKLLGFVT